MISYIYKIKLLQFFPPVNLSYVNLIIRSVKERRWKEGKFSSHPWGNSPHQVSAWCVLENFPPIHGVTLSTRSQPPSWGVCGLDSIGMKLLWDKRVQIFFPESKVISLETPSPPLAKWTNKQTTANNTKTKQWTLFLGADITAFWLMYEWAHLLGGVDLHLTPVSVLPEMGTTLWESWHVGGVCVCVLSPVQLFADCSPPGSSIRGISQARKLYWVAIFYSRGSFRPWDRTSVSCVSWTGRRILYPCTSWEVPWHIRKLPKLSVSLV